MKNPYTVLGVTKSASQSAIKDAYRKLARQHHPDSNTGNPKAEEAFKDLSVAYDVIGDAKKRKQFDTGEIDATGNPNHAHASARARRSGPGGMGGMGGMGGGGRNPFESFFRQRAGRDKRSVKVKGADVSYDLTIDFLEAASGAKKRVSMASGKRLEVNIPPATQDGHTLRLKGQGMGGVGGGGNGDARVNISVTPHPHFTLRGKNLHLDLPVTLAEAVDGGKVKVPTLNGTVNLNIPAGSNTGTVLRLKGKGVKPAKAKASGDQMVHLKIVLPPKPNAEFKEFISQWSAKHPFDPRKDLLKKTKAKS